MSDRVYDFGPAVENGVLRYVSASAITTADESQDGGCLRKWWLDKVAGLPVPEMKGQKVGKEVHGQLEHYGKTGEDVLGPIARKARPFIHKPGTPGVGIEYAFGFLPGLVPLTIGGVHAVGFVDVLNRSGTWIDPVGELRYDPGAIEVLDWKTSKDVARYAKSGTALLRTVQMPLYAQHAFELAPDVDRVRVSHVTIPVKGTGEAVKSTAVFDRFTIQARWFSIVSTVGRMVQAARETEAGIVPANYAACGAFGGCPFRDACPRSTTAVLRDAFGAGTERVMGVLDEIMAKNDTTNGTATTPAGASATGSAAHRGLTPGKDPMPKDLSLPERRAWLSAAQQYELEELEREEAAAKAPPAPPPAKAPEQKPAAKPSIGKAAGAVKASTCSMGKPYLVEFGGETVACTYAGKTKGGHLFAHPDLDSPIVLGEDDFVLPGDAVTPPDLPAPGASGPVAEPIPEGTVVPEAVRKAADKVAPAPAPEAKPEKAKRTRKKAEAAPEPAPEAVAAAAKALADTDPAPSETAAREASSRKPIESTLPVREPADEPVADDRVSFTEKGAEALQALERKVVAEGAGTGGAFVLLIDCVPTRAPTHRDLNEVIEQVHEAMRVEFKCADIRAADSDRLAFGRWKGAFSAALRYAIEQDRPTGYCLVQSGDELADLAIATLRTMADVVIQGVR